MMRVFGTTVLVAALIATAAPADSSRRVSLCPIEGDFKTLPAGMDLYSANRLWCWMKHQVNAPLALPPPPVFVGALPSNKYGVFLFPTPNAPEAPFSIEIAWDTVRYEDPLFVTWALGHELAHSLFMLRPYGFEEQTTYPAALPSMQHCDPEFRRVTIEAADVLWDIYHSSDQRSKMLSLDKERYGRECAFLSNLSIGSSGQRGESTR